MNSIDNTLLFTLTGFIFLIYLLYRLVSYVLKEEVPITNKANIPKMGNYLKQSTNQNNKVEVVKPLSNIINTEAEQTDDGGLKYYYMVTEESVGYCDSYSPITLFKKGNLLRRKQNALAYYDSRKETLALNKYLLTNSNIQPYYKLRLYLIQNIGKGEELEYLLKDEFGVRDENNYFFESILLDYVGLVKLGSPYQHNPNIYLFMIDDKWIYQTHEKYYISILGLTDSKHFHASVITKAFTDTILKPEVSKETELAAKAAKSYLLNRGKYLGWLN